MTQPPPKKAREFWIDQCGSDDEDNYAGTALYIHPRQGPLLWQSCLIHVIEISAVTRLQAQLACAKEALEFYADPKTYESKREREIKIGDYFAWECSFPIKEDHDGDKARAALAAISEEKD